MCKERLHALPNTGSPGNTKIFGAAVGSIGAKSCGKISWLICIALDNCEIPQIYSNRGSNFARSGTASVELPVGLAQSSAEFLVAHPGEKSVRTVEINANEGTDNALVVGADLEMDVLMNLMNGKPKAELDCDHLSPSDSASIRVPARFQPPALPHAVEDYSDAPRSGSVDPEFNWREYRWPKELGTAKRPTSGGRKGSSEFGYGWEAITPFRNRERTMNQGAEDRFGFLACKVGAANPWSQFFDVAQFLFIGNLDRFIDKIPEKTDAFKKCGKWASFGSFPRPTQDICKVVNIIEVVVE
ncbi:hypothetical protein C8R43DRAFT_1105957 [Mycena crocata]|nr:hypothetical protein C8R43DRAFT_1105957 [Mycena crocata]